MDNGCMPIDATSIKKRYKEVLDSYPELSFAHWCNVLRDVKYDEERALQQIQQSYSTPAHFGSYVQLLKCHPAPPQSQSRKRTREGLMTPVSPSESSANSSFGSFRTIKDKNPKSGIISPNVQSPKRRGPLFSALGSNSPLLPRETTAARQLFPTQQYPAVTAYMKSRKSPELYVGNSKSNSDFNTPSASPSVRRPRGSLFNIPHRSTKLSPKQSHIYDHIPGNSSYIEISDTEERDDEISSDEELFPTPVPANKRKTRKVNLDDHVLKHRGVTKATPRVRQAAGTLFGREIAPVEVGNSKLFCIEGLEKLTCDPTILKHQFEDSWEGSSTTGKIDFIGITTKQDYDRLYHGGVIIDGVTYYPGDCVLVCGPDKPLDSSKPRNRAQKNNKASEYDNDSEASEDLDSSPNPWFARIANLFEDKSGTEYAHLQWFRHGSDTIIEELASPRELFLTTECDDVELACVAGKLKVERVRREGVNELAEARFIKKNHFFYRFHYDNYKQRFTDATTYEAFSTQTRTSKIYCNSCDQKEKQEQTKTPQLLKEAALDGSIKAFQLDGKIYNIHDFIYIKPVVGRLCDISQIIKIRMNNRNSKSKLTTTSADMHLVVRLLYRCDVIHQIHKFYPEADGAARDERKLYISEEVIDITTDDLLGKCRVRHVSEIEDLNKYKDDKNSFWVKSKIRASQSGAAPFKVCNLEPSKMRYSTETEVEFSKYLSAKAKFLASGQKLTALELFGGCGGLALGLDLSGAVNTKYAIEFAPSAAATLKQNMPGCRVYNEDVSVCLQRALSQEARSPLLENEQDISGQPAMAMPSCGDVDMLVAGFPCPGYSGVNASPRVDDIKNTLILPTLSFAELFRPIYVLLENVVGLLSHRLGAKQLSKNKTGGGIPRGTLKFIIRVFITLGYQVEFTVLQAGEHDTPQSRNRVFFWAALLGHELPEFPQPTTTFPGNIPQSWHRKRSSAPHCGITVGDATSDLTSFDWVNPHNEVPLSHEEDMKRVSRATVIEQIPVLPNQLYVGKDEQTYATPPLCEFQRKLRNGVNNDQLINHVTSSWFDKPTRTSKSGALKFATTEQVCSIPLFPGADHRDLPEVLKPWCMSHPKSKAADHDFYPGRFGRLDLDKPFPICLTRVEPSGKSKVIHPNQYRILTIREFARAMGFPDWYKFDLETVSTKLAYRMIGNSVPVPLGKALGGELLEVLMRCSEKGFNGKVGVLSALKPSLTLEARSSSSMIESNRKYHLKEKGKTLENAILIDDED